MRRSTREPRTRRQLANTHWLPSSRPSETGRSSRSPKPTWNAPSPRLRQVKLKGPRTFDPVQQCDESEVVKLLGRSSCTGHHSPKCGGPREAPSTPPRRPDEESSGDSALDPQRRLSDTEVAALLTAHDPTAAPPSDCRGAALRSHRSAARRRVFLEWGCWASAEANWPGCAGQLSTASIPPPHSLREAHPGRHLRRRGGAESRARPAVPPGPSRYLRPPLLRSGSTRTSKPPTGCVLAVAGRARTTCTS